MADTGNGADPPTSPKRSRLRRAALDRADRRRRLWPARLHRVAGALDPSRASEGARQTSDGDADRPGHSRRCDQCRADRRPARRGLRHACRRLVSRRPDHAQIVDRNRRQRAAGPPVQGCAGQQSVLSRPARGSGVRKAGRQERRSPQPCPLLEGARQGRRRPAGMARRRDLRSKRRRQRLYRRRHAPYRRRYRCRTRAARGRSGERPEWWTPNTR